MQELHFSVSEQDKQIWCNSINNKLKNLMFYFYLIELNQEIVGFVELEKIDDYLFLDEFQLLGKVKHTKVIFGALNYLINDKDLKAYNELYFSILKYNQMSNKTFTHLGTEFVSEDEYKIRYKISREKVEKYIRFLTNS